MLNGLSEVVRVLRFWWFLLVFCLLENILWNFLSNWLCVNDIV